jgi:hypothetical protein
VRLDKGKPVRIDSRTRVNTLQQYLLSFHRWKRDAIRPAVGINVGRENEATNWIFAAVGMSRFTEHKHGAAFGSNKAIGLCRKSLAQARRR